MQHAAGKEDGGLTCCGMAESTRLSPGCTSNRCHHCIASMSLKSKTIEASPRGRHGAVMHETGCGMRACTWELTRAWQRAAGRTGGASAQTRSALRLAAMPC